MAGYSGTPLSKKLGLKRGQRIYVHDGPPGYFDWMHPLPESVEVANDLKGKFDLIHVFTDKQKSFQSLLLKAKKHLAEDGMLWISWPKKSSSVSSDVDENVIRDFGLKNGLVDVKVCAVNEVWSALKFVVPVKDRRQVRSLPS